MWPAERLAPSREDSIGPPGQAANAPWANDAIKWRTTPVEARTNGDYASRADYLVESHVLKLTKSEPRKVRLGGFGGTLLFEHSVPGLR